MEAALLGVFISIPVGVGTWFATNYIGEPFKSFWRLRRDVARTMAFRANVSAIATRDIQDQAADDFRALASRVDELLAAPTAVRRFWKVRGYDLATASGGLYGISNSITDDRGLRDIYRNRVERALKLPRQYTDAEMKDVVAIFRNLASGRH